MSPVTPSLSLAQRHMLALVDERKVWRSEREFNSGRWFAETQPIAVSQTLHVLLRHKLVRVGETEGLRTWAVLTPSGRAALEQR